MDYLNKCNLCPRNCNINRHTNIGFCQAKDKIKIARASLHYWEEPCISKNNGSGTIFFSNCNLKCIFCQNYEISTENIGTEITIEKFADICLDLQNKKALNINLVTPTIYVPLIIEGIKLAKSKGLKIPIIYNTSGYEKKETIKLLKGTIDIYMPDLKYYSDFYAIRYSNAKNYFKNAKDAIDEMYKQVGKPVYKNDILQKGVIIRHLMLPGLKEDSKRLIKYIYETYKDNIIISIMNQYTNIKPLKYNNLNRKVTNTEYDEIINYAYDLGIRNAYIQEGNTQKKSFIPDFKNQKF